MRRGGITAGDITLDGQPELVAFGSDNKNNPVLTAYRNGLPQQLYNPSGWRWKTCRLPSTSRGINLVASWDPGTDAITPSEALTISTYASAPRTWKKTLTTSQESMSFTTGVLRTKGPGNAGFPHRIRPATPGNRSGRSLFRYRPSITMGSPRRLPAPPGTPPAGSRPYRTSLHPSPAVHFIRNWGWMSTADGNLDLAFRPLFGGNARGRPSAIFELKRRDSSWSSLTWCRGVVPNGAISTTDGWPDAVYVNGDYLAVGLNNQDGSFSTDTENGISMRVNDLAVTDYNNNGEMGIIVASGSFTDDDSTRVVRHIGNGALELTDIVLPPALSAEAGDFNNDGCADLLLAGP